MLILYTYRPNQKNINFLLNLSISNTSVYKCLFAQILHFQVVHPKIQARLITRGAICPLWQNDCEIILEMNSIKTTPQAAFD